MVNSAGADRSSILSLFFVGPFCGPWPPSVALSESPGVGLDVVDPPLGRSTQMTNSSPSVWPCFEYSNRSVIDDQPGKKSTPGAPDVNHSPSPFPPDDSSSRRILSPRCARLPRLLVVQRQEYWAVEEPFRPSDCCNG